MHLPFAVRERNVFDSRPHPRCVVFANCLTLTNSNFMAHPKPQASDDAVPAGMAAARASAAEMTIVLRRAGSFAQMAYVDLSFDNRSARSCAARFLAAFAVVGCGERPPRTPLLAGGIMSGSSE